MAAGVAWFEAVAPPDADSPSPVSFSKLRDNHCLVSSKPSILDSEKNKQQLLIYMYISRYVVTDVLIIIATGDQS